MDTDYLIERTLKAQNPHYHELIAASTTAILFILEKYKSYFPFYTDHSIAHSLNVLDFLNRLIGPDNIRHLNADELYILIMGAYLHDTGMGITESDFEDAKGTIIPPDYLAAHPDEEATETIRCFHHELSGYFINKYHALFEIPSPLHVFSIAAVSKGHRVTDLYNEEEFPRKLLLENGNTVCIPYLGALLRLADEMDIAEDRLFSFDFPENDNYHKVIHHAIKKLDISDDAFIYSVRCEGQLLEDVVETIRKMEVTFRECKKLIEERTSFSLSQNKVIINRMV